MVGNVCIGDKVIGAIVEIVVAGKFYEGEVRMVSNGDLVAVTDFKPVNRTESAYAPVQEVQMMPEPTSQMRAAVGEEAAIIPIRRSWACFWAEKSGSKDILDPVWLDIGVVSVATAYHPKSGKVTFLIEPCHASGDGVLGYNITAFSSVYGFASDAKSKSQAKAAIADDWAMYCKQFEKPVPAAPEWLQIKDCIWVCEHNGWIALLNPAWAAPGLYLSRAWKASDITEHAGPTPLLPLDEAKAKILSLMI